MEDILQLLARWYGMLGLAILVAAAGCLVWAVLRQLRATRGKMNELAPPIIPASKARVCPYPYVYVKEDGTVRELRPDERVLLETPYHPCDSGRPATPKPSYDSKDFFGRIGGFCLRSAIPKDVTIREAFYEEVVPGELCKREGCDRPRVKHSTFCPQHYYEMLKRLQGDS